MHFPSRPAERLKWSKVLSDECGSLFLLWRIDLSGDFNANCSEAGSGLSAIKPFNFLLHFPSKVLKMFTEKIWKKYSYLGTALNSLCAKDNGHIFLSLHTYGQKRLCLRVFKRTVLDSNRRWQTRCSIVRFSPLHHRARPCLDWDTQLSHVALTLH